MSRPTSATSAIRVRAARSNFDPSASSTARAARRTVARLTSASSASGSVRWPSAVIQRTEKSTWSARCGSMPRTASGPTSERDGEPGDEPRFTREGVGERARARERVASG